MIAKLAELRTKGYSFDNQGHCRGCQAVILWFWTPAGKKIPLDPVTYEPHWGTCPMAAQFKNKRLKFNKDK